MLLLYLVSLLFFFFAKGISFFWYNVRIHAHTFFIFIVQTQSGRAPVCLFMCVSFSVCCCDFCRNIGIIKSYQIAADKWLKYMSHLCPPRSNSKLPLYCETKQRTKRISNDMLQKVNIKLNTHTNALNAWTRNRPIQWQKHEKAYMCKRAFKRAIWCLLTEVCQIRCIILNTNTKKNLLLTKFGWQNICLAISVKSSKIASFLHCT